MNPMTAPALTRGQWRQVAWITLSAATLFALLRWLPTGTNLSHMDFRVEGKGGSVIEFCDPLNPQFIPVVAVRSPVALAAARALEPLQSGLAKRGPEAFCHSLRALREKGYAILKTDFANGFNALSRQAMLDAVQLRCPQLTSLFNLFYTVEGACASETWSI